MAILTALPRYFRAERSYTAGKAAESNGRMASERTRGRETTLSVRACSCETQPSFLAPCLCLCACVCVYGNKLCLDGHGGVDRHRRKRRCHRRTSRNCTFQFSPTQPESEEKPWDSKRSMGERVGDIMLGNEWPDSSLDCDSLESTESYSHSNDDGCSEARPRGKPTRLRWSWR